MTTRFARSKWYSAVAGLSVAVLLGAVATPSAASTARSAPAALPLAPSLSSLADTAATGLKTSATQFTSASEDTARHTVTVYWQGNIPDDLRALQTTATRSGFTLRIVPSQQSRATLLTTAAAVAEATNGTGPREIVLADDGGSLTVSGAAFRDPATGTPTARGQQILTSATRSVAAQTRKTDPAANITAASSTINIVLGDNAAIVPAANRWYDASPFTGGAKINMRGFICSDAFGAVDNAGTNYMLTASHCPDYRDGDVATTDNGTVLGTFTGREYYRMKANKYDASLIKLSSGKTASGMMYDGGIGVSEFRKKVVGRSNYISSGRSLCASGAKTGARCSLVSGPQAFVCYDDDFCSIVIKIRTSSQPYVWAKGDSGGPVFSLGSVNNTVIAEGVISGITNGTNCPEFGTGNNCSKDGYFTSIAEFFQAGYPGGLRIKTG